MAVTKRAITIPSGLDPVTVLGPSDSILRRVENAFPEVSIMARGNRILLRASSKEADGQAQRAQELLETLIDSAYSGPLSPRTVERFLDQNRLNQDVPTRQSERLAANAAAVGALRLPEPKSGPDGLFDQEARRPRQPGVIAYAAGRPVRPKTRGQSGYVNAIETHTVTFGIGPAGTGKTYLAVAKAVQAFRSRQVTRIILTRPAVEAGENLGFLPGGLTEKVDPYLRPLYDALGDMLGGERMHRLMESGAIEVAPLAYMRGRTLNDAFVILDEAQNTTRQQMKMFLTRLGFNSRMVITGDVTQVDLGLPASGLVSIEAILGGVDDIAFVHLGAGDVVRHQLVGRIVQAYDRYAAFQAGAGRGRHEAVDAQTVEEHA
ncbi:PhoH family protein [Bifidobacterium xylocopae]|uniref:PhoH-like protein n=1 Tax=Bifidobacterium xylocopae TaxID=2493119 RepID=A0A366KCU4_9BIFI|nr:PhoH family protein [Bifidobacterium xylocopae]RBP98998.1 phosphate starvation-inducible protein PhoH [Bifidobacterium xylocopae]